MLSVPVIFKDNPIGVFIAVNKFPYFTEEDVKYIENVSKIIAIAIKNLEKQLQLHYLSTLNQKIIESVYDGIIVTDENCKILYVNEALLRMTGFRFGQDDVFQKDVYQIFPLFEKIKEKVSQYVKEGIVQDFLVGIFRIKVIPVISNYLFEPKIKNIIYVVET